VQNKLSSYKLTKTAHFKYVTVLIFNNIHISHPFRSLQLNFGYVIISQLATSFP